MRVLIASSKVEADEVRKALEGAGCLVDSIAPKRLDATRQRGYDFVVVDALVEDGVLRNGNVELDVAAHVIRRNKRSVRVTPLEFKVVQYFVEHKGEIVTKDDLIVGCWGVKDGASHNTIEVYVKRIRNKLGTSFIRTIHGVGYQMDKK